MKIDLTNNWWVVTGTMSTKISAPADQDIVTAFESVQHVATGAALFSTSEECQIVFSMNSATSIEEAREQGRGICQEAAASLDCQFVDSLVVHESEA